MVVIATIGGADDFVSATTFAKAKTDWFRDRLGLTLDNGIPSHDTINRVVAIINPAQFQNGFTRWVESRSDPLKLKQIPIDGKAMWGSQRRTAAGDRTVQIVSAWASENGVTPAQVRTDEKSNEITATPEFLALLDVSKARVRTDAAGCQKAIASQTVAGGGDDLLAAKENQARLDEDIKALAQAASETDHVGLSHRVTQEKSHGREAFRSGLVMSNWEGIRDRESWKGLKPVVCVTTQSGLGYFIPRTRSTRFPW